MTAINYFQTYSKRENHVTNNTLLMLRHVYQASPRLLERVVNSMLDGQAIELGPQFEQQVRGAHSVPDAVISQKPLHIYIETIHSDELGAAQIDKHMETIATKNHADDTAILIGLTAHALDEVTKDEWLKKANAKKIKFAAVTYGELVNILQDQCANDPALSDILEDYQAFIAGEGLLPTQYRTLVGLLCGQSWRENVDYGVYFEPAHRNPKWRQAEFLGVYHQKKISHIGRLATAAVCVQRDHELVVQTTEFGKLTDEHKDKIKAVIKAANAYYDGFAADPHRFYVVDNFVPTNLMKRSPGGMMGHRYFDIPGLVKKQKLDDIPKEATAAYIADLLQGEGFE